MNIIFLGHCFKKDKHDKIWGWIDQGSGPLSFWGRTGGIMSFKRYASSSEVSNQALKKSKKYIKKGPESWGSLLPLNFEGQVMIASLGRVKFDIAR